MRAPPAVSPGDDVTGVRDTSRRGYVYGLPTIDLYRILHNFALDPGADEFKAPLNAIFHSRQLADPTDRSIVAMNVDTPYSYAWLDLRAEPVVLDIPAFDPDRYVSAELIDLYTYIVGYVSPRTDGYGGGRFLIAGPSWTGESPPAMTVFQAPTELCLVLVRTQLFGRDDWPNVAAIQDAMAVQPLSMVIGAGEPPRPTALTPITPVDVRHEPTLEAFSVLRWMLRLMPVLPEDAELRRDLAAIGVGDDARAPIAPGEETAALAGMGSAVEEILHYAKTLRSSADIFGSRAFFAGNHLARAAGAFLGILGNAAEEYLGVGYQADAEGDPFNGTSAYRITFPPDGLPPVDAFWSITVYDADKLLYANEIDRYVIGSRDLERMQTDPNGALTIDVQHERPAAPRTANWLPCPAGDFTLTFRTYLPRTPIRTGEWTAPPVVPIRDDQHRSC